MCPFWSWCFLKSMTKTDKKKALPLRPKQKELDPSDLSPNEKAPSIHPGDGFFKEGASCFHGGNLFLMGGHLKRGGSPWRSTNPSIQPFDRSKEDWNLAPSSENSWPDHNCWSRKKIWFCSLEICEPCELVFPFLSALQSSRCIELSLGNKKIIPKCSGKVHLHTKHTLWHGRVKSYDVWVTM